MQQNNEKKSSDTLFPGKDQDNDNKESSATIPQINLPKGGGALKGIDEKFSVNSANGTASFSIPLPVTKSRANFQPALSLSYNSGSGNGIFGLGWNIDIQSVIRKTDKKLPTYKDEDVFIFSGEDLVHSMKNENGEWKADEEVNALYIIKRYRPRIEGAFARIEKIQEKNNGAFYFKVTTKDNVNIIFGRNANCRIADPENPERIYQWLIEIMYDDKGNCIVYDYKGEDLVGVQNTLAEKNRLEGLAKSTNKYPKQIRYGNIQPYYPDYTNENNIYNPPAPSTEFLFEIVFDYGEHGLNENTESESWPVRMDSFSSFRSGFEIRTRRLCKRVILFHHFTNREFELAANDERVAYLVKSLDLDYVSSSDETEQKSEVTYLSAARQTGYRKKATGYDQKSFPPAEFSYERLRWNKVIQTIAPGDIVHSPTGLSNNYHWLDLYNEGIPGIFSEQADAFYYKSNKGNGHFSNAQIVSPKPSLNGFGAGMMQLQDLDGDGSKQLVSSIGGVSGYFELSDEGEWKNFSAFNAMPVIDWRDENTRLIDLNGDGKADVLITEENVFGWYASAGKRGWSEKLVALKERDEEKGPAIVFANDSESIFLADMSGDGMSDIVRIRNGEICYWPNKGFGSFGPKVAMDNAPFFDHPDQFNPVYLHLADISGTGATDILYLGKNKFRSWLNLSGNAWSDVCEIDPFFSTASPRQFSVVDLLGNGTGCIVCSSSLPADANAPMRYIDLMGGKKPHVLTGYKNNFGKETQFEYKSSTYYYLKDKSGSTPWISKLPFPVQCVSKVIVRDTVSDLRFTNSYVYHHGYYDHAEREFRGFGMVEQIDTEEYKVVEDSGASNGSGIAFYEPPVLTKTWFHLGAYFRDKKILDHYKHEYWYNQGAVKAKYGDLSDKEFPLREGVLPDNLSVEELIEAHRACKGMVLRQEVFAVDGRDKELLPYSVATHNCIVRFVQPSLNGHYAVFTVHESEAFSYSFERNVDDPRVSHSINIKFDSLGNVLRNAAIVYPRRERPVELEDDRVWDEQNKKHIIYNENKFTSDVVSAAVYRLRMPYEMKSFELKGIDWPLDRKIYGIEDFSVPMTEISYEKEFTPGVAEKRLIEHIKHLYLADDLKTVKAEGEHDSAGILHESYQLAFTPGLLDYIYKDGNNASKVDVSMLLQGKYVDLNIDGNWWIRSGTVQLIDATETVADAAQRLYSPMSYTDPFGSVTRVEYYSNYFLLVNKTTDAMENSSSIEKFDFRTVSPTTMKDENANIQVVVYDIMGMVAGAALLGKGGEADDLSNFVADLDDPTVAAFMNDPSAHAADLLQHTTSRIVYDFNSVPCRAATIVREEHYAVNPTSKLQYSFEYSDGMGNVIMKKVQAAPDANNAARWIGNGRTILNNKGKAIKQYEPYYSSTHAYEPEKQFEGVTPLMYYDSSGKLIKTEMPDGTFSKVEYDSWKQTMFDANDTVTESEWYRKRTQPTQDDLNEFINDGKDGLKEKIAAEKSAAHAHTPTVIHLDVLGRTFCTVLHNKRTENSIVLEAFHTTINKLDIEGNLLAVTDASENEVMRYKHDMLAQQVYQHSMDAGQRWMLNDCLGKPVYSWDNKEQRFETSYDELHRPIENAVQKGGITVKTEKIEYTDTKNLAAVQLTQEQGMNRIGKIVEHYDGAGKMSLMKYDFKGNSLQSKRLFCEKYDEIPNWDTSVAMQADDKILISLSEFDALNRLVKTYAPTSDPQHVSNIVPLFNESNLLIMVKALVRNSSEKYFVTKIEYDAKGQRDKIYYDNDTVTRYSYDKMNFKLIRLLTTANASANVLQDLQYVYDPSGNITSIQDYSKENIVHNGEEVVAKQDFEYDAIYQLIKATGREHAGQNNVNENIAVDKRRNYPFDNGASANDMQALRNYSQLYSYDKASNITKLQHVAKNGSWTKTYWYNNNDADRNDLSVPPTIAKNNQLLQTQTGTSTPLKYEHDVHGCITSLSHLNGIVWNYKDEIGEIDLGGGGRAYYIYDGNGQRVRKVIERLNGIVEERIYAGAIEIFTSRNGNGTVTEQTETLHIMDGTKRITMVDTPLVTSNNNQQVFRFIYGNHLGSSSLELNGNAETISYEEYHPYGTTSIYFTNAAIKAAAKRYRYTGMERDEESGMTYHSARFYLPWMGRWLNCDPIGIKGGQNLYSFSRNNPLVFTDTGGLNPIRITQHGDELSDEDVVPRKDGVGQIILSHWLHGNGDTLYLREGKSDVSTSTQEFTLCGQAKMMILPVGLGAYMWKGIMVGKDDKVESRDTLNNAMNKVLLEAVDKEEKKGGYQFIYSDYESPLFSQSVEPISKEPSKAETKIHLNVPNGEGISGHSYLHGSNSKVGDVIVAIELIGKKELYPESNSYKVQVKFHFTWNDMIDPNAKYESDQSKVKWARRLGKLYDFTPTDYRIMVEWERTLEATVTKKGVPYSDTIEWRSIDESVKKKHYDSKKENPYDFVQH